MVETLLDVTIGSCLLLVKWKMKNEKTKKRKMKKVYLQKTEIHTWNYLEKQCESFDFDNFYLKKRKKKGLISCWLFFFENNLKIHT